MICIIQRVSKAHVSIANELIGQTHKGLVVLGAIHADDTSADLEWIAAKIVTLRIFPNGEKHFDLDVKQVGGSILLVSNFTVAGDTRKGRRPSLDGAASPDVASKMFEQFVQAVRNQGVEVQTGRFGADMEVHLVNDGPVTFILDSRTSR